MSNIQEFKQFIEESNPRTMPKSIPLFRGKKKHFPKALTLQDINCEEQSQQTEIGHGEH